MNIKTIIVTLLLALLSAGTHASDSASIHVVEARELVQQFFGSLKGELEAALEEGGPVTAISICKLKAPRLTKELSTLSGWYIARTALKIRNPNNQPDTWEQQVMEQFETRKANGEALAEMEYSEQLEVAGRKIFRYMKAIEVMDLCLNCHGEDVKPEIRRILAQLYPNDQARGFKQGDLRGAFTLAKPLQSQTQ
jgi:hypothetical protein